MNRPTALALALLAVALIAGVAFFRTGPRRSGDSGIVEIDGRIEAAREVISARVPGKLIAFTVAPGDTVAARQVIARLHDPRMTAKLAAAEEALAAIETELREEQAKLAWEQLRVPLAIHAAESNLTVAKRLREDLQTVELRLREEIGELDELEEPDEAGAQRLRAAVLEHQHVVLQLVEAEHGVEHAESDLELVRLDEDELVSHIHLVEELVINRDSAAALVRVAAVGEGDLEVAATSAGVVVSPRAAVGATLSIGDPVLELMDPAALGIIATATDAHRADIRPGQQARIHFEGAHGGLSTGTVSAILDSPGGGLIVKLVFDATPNPAPPSSLPCKVVIRTREDAPWP